MLGLEAGAEGAASSEELSGIVDRINTNNGNGLNGDDGIEDGSSSTSGGAERNWSTETEYNSSSGANTSSSSVFSAFLGYQNHAPEAPLNPAVANSHTHNRRGRDSVTGYTAAAREREKAASLRGAIRHSEQHHSSEHRMARLVCIPLVCFLLLRHSLSFSSPSLFFIDILMFTFIPSHLALQVVLTAFVEAHQYAQKKVRTHTMRYFAHSPCVTLHTHHALLCTLTMRYFAHSPCVTLV
jgi:hypothetical protein